MTINQKALKGWCNKNQNKCCDPVYFIVLIILNWDFAGASSFVYELISLYLITIKNKEKLFLFFTFCSLENDLYTNSKHLIWT